MEKPFLDVLKNRAITEQPVWWMMRQAGRYLPEYREVRAEAGSFLDLAYNPDFATEVTLQPIRRYGMDAAILFSDILVIPHALGQNLRFVQGEGPKLDPVTSPMELGFDRFEDILKPVYAAVRQIRYKLNEEGFEETSLIGFAGAPWTVACYMIEGGGSKDFAKAKTLAYANDAGFAGLIDLICEATVEYLCRQVEAGAEALQIFDTWAGLLDEAGFKRWSIDPAVRIIAGVREKYPHIPIIGFPRGAGSLYLSYVLETGVDGVSIDPSVAAAWAAKYLQPHCVVQGNLDPIRLLAGGEELDKAVDHVFENLSYGPHIFNLGHGIHKDTPPEHVGQLAQKLKSGIK